MSKRIHILSDIDPVTKTAVCACCGVVGVYRSPHMNHWVCRKKRGQDRSLYYRRHPEKRRPNNSVEAKTRQILRHKKRDKEIRLECIQHYGGKCVFCGDSNPHHLTFDHINDDGAIHRKIIGRTLFVRWLKRNNYPDDIQLLCWNHNEEKEHYHTMS